MGRTNGGYVFHCTRNTAATELRAGGMDEADAMKITGHITSAIFKRYAADDVEALRERLARARDKATASLSERRQRIARAAKVSGS